MLGRGGDYTPLSESASHGSYGWRRDYYRDVHDDFEIKTEAELKELIAAYRSFHELLSILFLFMLAGAGAVAALIKSLAFFLSKSDVTIWNGILFTLASGTIAGALFVLRRFKRIYFGALEVGFAAASCYVAFMKFGGLGIGSLERITATVGAVYLFVRGFSNIDDGIVARNTKKKQLEDQLAKLDAAKNAPGESGRQKTAR
jgi:hypothetical protein